MPRQRSEVAVGRLVVVLRLDDGVTGGMAGSRRRQDPGGGGKITRGVAAAVVLVEGMMNVGLRTSTRSEYGPQLPKTYL